MGPEPLEASFDATALAQALAGKRTALKVALLDQGVVAGLGNIYASEALYRAGLSPLRRSSTLATTAGRPTEKAVRLAAAIKSVLRRGDRPRRTSVPRRPLPRLRTRGRAVPNAWLPRNDPPNHSGRPIDVLLSVVSALIAGAASLAGRCKITRSAALQRCPEAVCRPKGLRYERPTFRADARNGARRHRSDMVSPTSSRTSHVPHSAAHACLIPMSADRRAGAVRRPGHARARRARAGCCRPSQCSGQAAPSVRAPIRSGSRG